MAEMSMSKSYSNYMKSKAQLKQKFYCEMCHKQCRDDNGFKCHCQSDGHMRMMELFKENSFSIIGNNSTEFENGYLSLLSLRYGDQRANANTIYCEYIKDRNHMHMNATRWNSLTEFVLSLGRSGKCVVEQGDRDGEWYLRYIDKDPQKWSQIEEKQERIRLETDEDERQRRKFAVYREKQVEAQGGEPVVPQPTTLRRGNPEEKLTVSLHTTRMGDASKIGKVDFQAMEPVKRSLGTMKGAAPPRSALDEIMESELRMKQRRLERDIGERDRQIQALESAPLPSAPSSSAPLTSESDRAWVMAGIVVKILNEEILGGKLFKEKCAVEGVEDEFLATVRVLRTGTVLKIDQADLETVIPAAGGRVKLLEAPFRGQSAEVLQVNLSEYNVDVKLNKVLPGLGYEAISRECDPEPPAAR